MMSRFTRNTAVSSFARSRGCAPNGAMPRPTAGADVPSWRPAIAQRGVIVCVSWMNPSVAPTSFVAVVKVSWITSPEIFVYRTAYSPSKPASVNVRSAWASAGTNSDAFKYAPWANDAPRRSPMIGVTPAPASNTGVAFGLVVTPAIEIRTGAELVTAARASQCDAETVKTPASGYVDAMTDGRALPVSKGSSGVK